MSFLCCSGLVVLGAVRCFQLGIRCLLSCCSPTRCWLTLLLRFLLPATPPSIPNPHSVNQRQV